MSAQAPGSVDAATRKLVDRALLGELSPGKRRAFMERLRHDEAARAEYDRAAAALRVLEGDPVVGGFEIDLVGQWITEDFADAAGRSSAAPAFSWSRLWAGLGFAAVAAALVLLLWPRASSLLGGGPGDDDPFSVKGPGDPDGALAIEVLCTDGPDAEPMAAVDDACHLQRDLAFSVYVEPGTRGSVTLFGVDADGDVMFYAPTPDDAEAIAVKPGGWRAVSMGVHLGINHAAGRLRVYGLLAPRGATVDEVRAIGAALAEASPATPDDPPWNERVPASLLESLCASPRDCHAAEQSFEVHPAPRTEAP